MKELEHKIIADILSQHGYEDRSLERHLLNYWIKKCRKDSKRQTKQTLKELKQKVRGLEKNAKYFDPEYEMPNQVKEFREAVIILIDDIINE